MLTENRSSNTEMVSVPCEELQRFIENAACLGRSPQWVKDKAALLNAIAQPAAQPLGWVYEGGQEFTSDPDRAHDLRAEGIELTAVYGHAQPADQHQGEPVGEVVAFGEGLHEVAWAKGKMPSLGAKLYTHPDAGEVERLRRLVDAKECERQQHLEECAAEVNALRAQLAERGALLREANGLLKVSSERLPRKHQTIRAHIDHLRSVVETALSASAEPKCQDGGMCADSSHKCTGCARDERALFGSAHVAKCFNFNRKTVLGMLGEYGNPYVQSTWEGWQARAALERKS